MKKIKINVLLVLLCFFIVLLSVESVDANPPRICIELDAGCPGATYATLASHTKTSHFKVVYTDPITGRKFYKESIWIQNEVTVQAGVTTEKRIFGRKLGCWSGGSNHTTSYRNLFYHNFKRWPTEAELADISYTDASNWFRSLHQNSCWPAGPRFARVDGTLTEQVGGKVCFDFPNVWMTQFGFQGNVFWPIFMELRFPNGKVCAIEGLRIRDVPRPPNGQTVNVKVKVEKPCPNC